jgi:hypothetical protein
MLTAWLKQLLCRIRSGHHFGTTSWEGSVLYATCDHCGFRLEVFR